MEARGSKTNLAMIFHTDSAAAFVGSRPDILGLMCLRKAVSGGESLMVSGHTAYDVLLATRPDLVDELYGEFLFDRSKDTEEGEDPISTGSVFTDTADGVRIRYNRLHIELGHYLSGNPLTERQREALDAFDAILNDPANAVEFTMAPAMSSSPTTTPCFTIGVVSTTHPRWRTGAAWCGCGSQRDWARRSCAVRRADDGDRADRGAQGCRALSAALTVARAGAVLAARTTCDRAAK